MHQALVIGVKFRDLAMAVDAMMHGTLPGRPETIRLTSGAMGGRHCSYRGWTTNLSSGWTRHAQRSEVGPLFWCRGLAPLRSEFPAQPISVRVLPLWRVVRPAYTASTSRPPSAHLSRFELESRRKDRKLIPDVACK